MSVQVKFHCLAGINLNILECKSIQPTEQQHHIMRINLNILECKYWTESDYVNSNLVLILTYWNVNFLEVRLYELLP